MTSMTSLLLTLGAGLGLGIVFYGGLWLTVSRMGSTAHPILLVAASFLARTAFALAGIWLVSGGELKPLVFCLAGFLTGRWLILWKTRSPGPV